MIDARTADPSPRGEAIILLLLSPWLLVAFLTVVYMVGDML